MGIEIQEIYTDLLEVCGAANTSQMTKTLLPLHFKMLEENKYNQHLA